MRTCYGRTLKPSPHFKYVYLHVLLRFGTMRLIHCADIVRGPKKGLMKKTDFIESWGREPYIYNTSVDYHFCRSKESCSETRFKTRSRFPIRIVTFSTLGVRGPSWIVFVQQFTSELGQITLVCLKHYVLGYRNLKSYTDLMWFIEPMSQFFILKID
jgi:hypothetical protein